jgi:preprotein translocase subunit SecG
MITFLTILYVVVCVFLILVVLLQAGRGGGMGSAFGGSSQSVFGGAGAGNFLTRLTVIMAAMFMVLSASLAYLSTSSDKALEKASRAVKAREDARKLDAKSKKDTEGKAPSADNQAAPASVAPASSGESVAEPAGDGLSDGLSDGRSEGDETAPDSASQPAIVPAEPPAPAKPPTPKP